MSDVKTISSRTLTLIFWLKYIVFTPSMFKWKHVGRVNMSGEFGLFTCWELQGTFGGKPACSAVSGEEDLLTWDFGFGRL